MLQSARASSSVEFARTVERVVSSTGVTQALTSMRDLARTSQGVSPDEALSMLRPLVASHSADPLGAYLALFAISRLKSSESDAVLARALASGDLGLAEHAAWGLSRRRPVAAAVPLLMDLAEQGGFSQMMAELALEHWMSEMPDVIWQAGRPVPDRLWPLARRRRRPPEIRSRAGGLRLAQILMQGRVDADLTAPGSGDGGGLITLQVGLTRELARHSEVSDVYLITRSVTDRSGLFDTAIQEVTPGGVIARVGFGGSDYLSTADMWPHRAELERNLRELLHREGPFDALHLRFADVGTFVGARLARELGIPIFFTLAPDPHAVIESAERAGLITRGRFAPVDLEEHYVFRTWLVEWMLDRAHRLALLPRAGQSQQLERLLGIDINAGSGRFRVIAEGVDTDLAEEARTLITQKPKSELPPIIAELGALVDSLPEAKQGLPLIFSAGRLNRVKGMDRLVAAWAGDDEVRNQYNLLIVGGDLENPSEEERLSLDAIARAVGDDTAGLLMLGGRSHSDVALLMSAVAEGVEGVADPGGIYVSGSAKEEFGLAIVEALAAGLPVVAPANGGPSSYVEHGFTGFLADTAEIARIREGIRWAGDARLSEVRADAARRMVRSHYSLASMADQLVEFYGEARQAELSAS